MTENFADVEYALKRHVSRWRRELEGILSDFDIEPVLKRHEPGSYSIKLVVKHCSVTESAATDQNPNPEEIRVRVVPAYNGRETPKVHTQPFTDADSIDKSAETCPDEPSSYVVVADTRQRKFDAQSAREEQVRQRYLECVKKSASEQRRPPAPKDAAWVLFRTMLKVVVAEDYSEEGIMLTHANNEEDNSLSNEKVGTLPESVYALIQEAVDGFWLAKVNQREQVLWKNAVLQIFSQWYAQLVVLL